MIVWPLRGQGLVRSLHIQHLRRQGHRRGGLEKVCVSQDQQILTGCKQRNPGAVRGVYGVQFAAKLGEKKKSNLAEDCVCQTGP